MSIEEDLRNFSRIAIFAALELEAQRILAFSCETLELRSGEILFCKGEQSDGGYVVLDGSITLRGDSELNQQIAKPYALIGEIAIISETERTSTALARDDAKVLKVTRGLFLRVLKEYPQSAVRVRDLISRRLRGISVQLEEARQNRFT